MALSWKPGVVCMTGKGLSLFEIGSNSDFSNNYTMYTTGERSEPLKNNLWTPSPSNKLFTQDHFVDES